MAAMIRSACRGVSDRIADPIDGRQSMPLDPVATGAGRGWRLLLPAFLWAGLLLAGCSSTGIVNALVLAGRGRRRFPAPDSWHGGACWPLRLSATGYRPAQGDLRAAGSMARDPADRSCRGRCPAHAADGRRRGRCREARQYGPSGQLHPQQGRARGRKILLRHRPYEVGGGAGRPLALRGTGPG